MEHDEILTDSKVDRIVGFTQFLYACEKPETTHSEQTKFVEDFLIWYAMTMEGKKVDESRISEKIRDLLNQTSSQEASASSEKSKDSLHQVSCS